MSVTVGKAAIDGTLPAILRKLEVMLDLPGSAGVSRPEVAILTYHSLDDSGSVLSTSPVVFVEHMRILAELGASVVPLNDLLDILHKGAPAQRLVAITFDDGFQNLYQHAFPVLVDYGFPATVFLVTDYCGKDNAWPSQPSHVERRPLLRWPEVKEMSAAGIQFGSHTRTHPDLRKVPDPIAEQEMTISKMAIEDATGRSVETFAYPYGAYDDRVRKLARSHFALACSAALGFAPLGHDCSVLPRLEMYYLRRPSYFRRLFSGELKVYLGVRNAMRTARDWCLR